MSAKIIKIRDFESSDAWESTLLHDQKSAAQTAQSPAVNSRRFSKSCFIGTFAVFALLFVGGSFLLLHNGKSSAIKSNVNVDSAAIDTSSAMSIKAVASGPLEVRPGTFTCSHADSKTSFCVGDIITYSLSVTGSNSSTFNDADNGPTLMDCQVRGAPNGEGGITRPGGPRGFIGPCYPSVSGKNLQDFLNEGGKGTFTIPAENYIGFSQSIDLYFYYEKAGGSSNFLVNAFCPSFSVTNCTTTTTSSSATSSTTSSSTASSSVTGSVTTVTTTGTSSSTGTGTATASSTTTIKSSGAAGSLKSVWVACTALVVFSWFAL